MQDKIILARTVTKFIAGSSVSSVVSTAIKNVVPTTNKLEQVQLAIGAFVIGSMARDKANAWTEAKFNDTYDRVMEFKSLTEEDTPAE